MDTPLSIYGAIALAHSLGVHLTESSFRSAVSRERAPRAAFTENRQPYWDRQTIATWANSYTDGRRGDTPAAPGPLNLQAAHLLTGTPGSDVEHAHHAIAQLPAIISDLERATTDQESAYARAAKNAEPPQLEDFTLKGIARLLRESRSARTTAQTLDTYAEHLTHAQALLDATRHDLDHANTWLTRAHAYTEWAAQQRHTRDQHATFTQWLNQTPTIGHTTPIDTWIRDDPRRIAYINGHSKMRQWNDLTDHERDALPTDDIILNGADFGYKWHVPDINGTCRLSWISATNELYLVATPTPNPPNVTTLTTLPNDTSLEAVIAWMNPFERALHENPNAYGLLAREITYQNNTGWRSLHPTPTNH